MLISLCTPVMNRLSDLKRTMPYRIEAALKSPPVEFAILDYNSSDGLDDWLAELVLPRQIGLTTRRYEGRNYYHQAHAYNLAILLGNGEVFSLMGADTYPIGDYFEVVRDTIGRGAVWVEDERYKGAIACQKAEFVEAGGFDERFELYGPEDRELAVRLVRRGARKGILPPGLIGNFHTPDEVKMANYRFRMKKKAASRLMRPIFDENVKRGVTQVNPQGWGSWT